MAPPGLVTTASVSSNYSLDIAVLPPVSGSIDYHKYLRAETIQSKQPSQLTATKLHPEGLICRRDVSKFVPPYDKVIKGGIFGVYSPFPFIRVTFFHLWSCCLCNFAIRIGPIIAPKIIGGRKAQDLAHYGKIGLGLCFSLDMPERCRRKLDIGLCVVQGSVQSRSRMSLHCVIECPRIVPRRSEIMQLALEGSVEGVQCLLAAGRATARDVTVHGTTLLHLASKTSNLHLIRLLIQEGGDVNAQNGDGDTPLHWAMNRRGNYEAARLLIENGADLANHAVDDRTPLHTYFNDTVKKVLLRDDWIEETLPDSQGMSIAHFLAWSSKSTPGLFRRGLAYTSTNLWYVDGFGRTCLHLAASRGNVDILEYLLERSSVTEVRRKDYEGRTALHYAAQNKRVKTIDLLLTGGGDLHAKDNLSRTVLHDAARWGNLEVVQKVVALGKSEILLSPDKDGQMPSFLVPGQKVPAPTLRRFLADSESTATLKTNSKEQTSLDQGSSTGILPKASSNTFSSKAGLVRMMAFAVVPSASRYVSVQGIVPYVIATILYILYLVITTKSEPPDSGLGI